MGHVGLELQAKLFDLCDERGVLHATLGPEGDFRSGRLASVQMIEEGQPVPDPAGTGASLIEELSAEDFGSKGIQVDPEGRFTK